MFHFQQEAADCLCRLLKKCLDKNPNPNSKVLKNLCTFLCVDPTFTPRVASPIPSHTGNNWPSGLKAKVSSLLISFLLSHYIFLW